MRATNSTTTTVEVIDAEGVRAVADGAQLSAQSATVVVTLEDDREAYVAAELFEQRDDGRYYLPVRLNSVANVVDAQTSQRVMVVPLIEEQLRVRKVEVPAERVRVVKRVEETLENVAVPLMRERLEVRRVPVKRMVDQPQPMRTAGDTIIIPVHEEVIVVEKRTMLVEEIHVIVEKEEELLREEHHLRRETVEIEQDDALDTSTNSTSNS